MASEKWSELHPDILSIISKFLDTDVDILRLRAVCPSWRSSVLPRRRPSPFPLKVPPLPNNHQYRHLYTHGHHSLNYTTLYRLSPPEFGPYAGDPSDGWLFRVLEVNPNRFTFLAPLTAQPYRKIRFTPETIPKQMNLLDYRISEVCKCYTLDFTNYEGSVNYKGSVIKSYVKKVLVIPNYAIDCDFVVFVLLWDDSMIYWKFGDKDWTQIDTKGYQITDIIVSKGKCYAIGFNGVLVSFDSKFNLVVIPSLPRLPLLANSAETFLAEYKSSLFAMLTVCHIDTNEKSLELKIFEKCNNYWKPVNSLGNVVLISCDDAHTGLSVEDFRGRKGNCVYLGLGEELYHFENFFADNIHYSIYDLDKRTTLAVKMTPDCTLMYWPPPKWLISN